MDTSIRRAWTSHARIPSGQSMQFKPQALRLLYFGFHDEALGLIRSIGKIANLLFLFNLDQTVYADWKALPEDRRRQKFGPVMVRIALEDIATAKSVELRLLSVGEDRYRTLSARSAHVTPETKQQDYSLRGRPVLGGLFRGQPGPRQPRPQKNLEQNSAQGFVAPKRPFTAEEFRSVTRSHFFMGAVSFWREIERRVQLDEAIRIHASGALRMMAQSDYRGLALSPQHAEALTFCGLTPLGACPGPQPATLNPDHLGLRRIRHLRTTPSLTQQ